jgi:hypothetical protein
VAVLGSILASGYGRAMQLHSPTRRGVVTMRSAHRGVPRDRECKGNTRNRVAATSHQGTGGQRIPIAAGLIELLTDWELTLGS